MHSIKTCIVTIEEPDLALSLIAINVIAFIILINFVSFNYVAP